MEAAAMEPRVFEVGKSAYYVKDGSTVCRGKIISKHVGPSYKLRGANGPIIWDKLFDTAEEAKATIVPQSWWRGNGRNGH